MYFDGVDLAQPGNTKLEEYYHAQFQRYRRFIFAKGAPDDAFWIGGVGRAVPEGCPLIITYAPPPAPTTHPEAGIRWSTPTGPAQVVTDLPTALFLLAFAFDRPDALSWLTGLPADTPSATACDRLQLPQDTCRHSVDAYDPGEYVAPDRNGWVHFLVETHGEVVPLATGPQPAPLLQMCRANQLQSEHDLPERLAVFLDDA